jgi:hypothetical protein
MLFDSYCQRRSSGSDGACLHMTTEAFRVNGVASHIACRNV